jgi:hypothetical protein
VVPDRSGVNHRKPADLLIGWKWCTVFGCRISKWNQNKGAPGSETSILEGLNWRVADKAMYGGDVATEGALVQTARGDISPLS